MEKNMARELAVELTVEITKCCDSIRGRTAYVNQLLRSASSVGANISEAKYAQSRADLIHKLEIALKECHETEYWLEVLYRLDTIPPEQYQKLVSNTESIMKILIASVRTIKNEKEERMKSEE